MNGRDVVFFINYYSNESGYRDVVIDIRYWSTV